MALKIEDCAYRRPGVVPCTSLFFGDGSNGGCNMYSFGYIKCSLGI